MQDRGGAFEGRRVFLAEDHFSIALAMTGLVEQLGGSVVAREGDAASAAETARTVDADIALLDINLGDGPCYQAAQAFLRRGIAVIFTTGYDIPPDMPPSLDDVPRLVKPVIAADLKRAMRSLELQRRVTQRS